MKIEDLQARLQKATEKVHKIEGTIERHKKAAKKKRDAVIKLGVDPDKTDYMEFAGKYDDLSRSIYWALSEYQDKLRDIRESKKKLEDAKVVANNWANKLQFEIYKEEQIEKCVPKIIKEFVENWKKLVIQWHIENYKRLMEFEKTFRDKENAVKREYILTSGEYDDTLARGMTVDQIMGWCLSSNKYNKFAEEKGVGYKQYKEKKSSFGAMALRLQDIRNEKDRMNYLEKVVEQDKKTLILDLMARINKVVGNIKDASGLYIGDKGEINGFIVGDSGRAKVETISAGGYNIQCFHFRTLVKQM